MNLSYFSPIYGLTTSTDNSPENGGLYLAEYYRLKSDLNLPITDIERIPYIDKMSNAKVSEGLYRRDVTRLVRTVSHDEITGFLVSSKLLNTNHASEIWKYLLKHLFVYDPNNNRLYPAFAPQWICLWGELMESWLFKWLLPYVLINILLDTKLGSNRITSGKLLYFTLLNRNSLLWKIYTYRMKRIYGNSWQIELFKIYFPKEDREHPLIYLAERI